MNPFLNPTTGLPLLKHFLFDESRLRRMSIKQVERYRDKALKKIVKYAYTVPIYNKKYKELGIHPNDIKGIQDIKKLPYITKKELAENFPDDVVPQSYNKNRAQIVSTGGSTGKPISIYTDFYLFSESIGAPLRLFHSLNLNFRKLKMANIGTFFPNRAGHEVQKAVYSKLPFFSNFRNRLNINAFDPIKEIIDKLDDFKPDFILSYPVTFQNLAYLKNKGYGKNIKPKILESSGYILDEYTRRYVQDAFGCRMLSVYGSVEGYSEAPIAFECLEGIWHINYDFFHIETINENMELIGPNKRGHIVVTKLFGRCEPIIRYTGMDDWVTLSPIYKCKCGLCTPIFKDGVEGRISSSVVLPNGIIYPGASFDVVSLVLNEFKPRKIKRFQIVQKKIDEIEILLVIDEDLRNVGPSVDLLFKKIKERYDKKIGSDIKIDIREVEENEIKSSPFKPAPLVISYLTQEDREKVLY